MSCIKSIPNRSAPSELIDTNVRIDYDKLRHVLTVGRQTDGYRLNENFDILHEVIGEEQVAAQIRPGFPLERLAEPEHFISLLHFFGLLSIRGGSPGTPELAIPNQTVKRLMYAFLRDGYRDVRVFSVNLYHFEQLLMRMAIDGEWRPVFDHLSQAIAQQTGIRDYMAGEKVIQGFLAAFLSVSEYYVFRSETELGKGHADIALEPVVAAFPDVPYGYLIELKYRARSESADEAAIAAAAGEARAQLTRYLADDRLARQFPSVRFIGLIVVFHGWEMVFCDSVTGNPPCA